MSFVVYNNSGDDFTETVRGKTIGSAIPDYEIVPDRGSVNPWRVDSVPAGRGTTFTVRIRRGVTAGEQKRLNAIPIVDTGAASGNPIAPDDVGFVTFRTYIPSGGNKTVELPTVIVNRIVNGHGRHARPRIVHVKLPTCNSVRIGRAIRSAASSRTQATPTSRCTSIPRPGPWWSPRP